MVGAGWLVVMDDWMRRGGRGGAMLGFLAGAVLLLPIAHTYGRLVRLIPDAGAEIAYAERVFPPAASFSAGWMMVLAYSIVCPWEAVAIGNLLARLFPEMNAVVLYTVAGKAITLPRLLAGLGLTAAIGLVNYRGIRLSGRFQDITTIGLLVCFAVFVALGIGHGSPANAEPLFAPVGPFVSVLLVMQIVPYFLTGFESIPKASEEALPNLRSARCIPDSPPPFSQPRSWRFPLPPPHSSATPCSSRSVKLALPSERSAGAPRAWRSSPWRAATTRGTASSSR